MTVHCETQIDLDGNYAVVAVIGGLDHTTAPDVRHHVRTALDSGLHRVVVDASGVHSVDNAGVGTLCSLSRQAATMGGWLRVVGLPQQLVSVVEAAAEPGTLALVDRAAVPADERVSLR